ncbi:hypothetical protein BDK51DRAFT_41822 [Blyttiomyces helicus]|uniref:Uncharacterized protein n=1 Tax=Blyttiomyces helicus TaxID=388810 RepID=A0A4P9WBB5_9FUNG|nr:hypothetical protein BDK51DRAFT_41822 [Blyttiomyces helicus]|eukprot:RKO88448.1 hypothetical protein BDK51DRAFT_41822 [Blyttiomyces helicus]
MSASGAAANHGEERVDRDIFLCKVDAPPEFFGTDEPPCPANECAGIEGAPSGSSVAAAKRPKPLKQIPEHVDGGCGPRVRFPPRNARLVRIPPPAAGEDRRVDVKGGPAPPLAGRKMLLQRASVSWARGIAAESGERRGGGAGALSSVEEGVGGRSCFAMKLQDPKSKDVEATVRGWAMGGLAVDVENVRGWVAHAAGLSPGSPGLFRRRRTGSLHAMSSLSVTSGTRTGNCVEAQWKQATLSHGHAAA